jgi:hypothetical protein
MTIIWSFRMSRLPLLIAAALLSTLSAAHAQTAKPAAAAPAKPLLDNERVRVSEMKIASGAKIALPDRPDQFAYLLTDASLVFSVPGHTPYQLDFKAGEATLLPAQSTEAANESGQEVRAVLVEIKRPGGSGKALTTQAKGKSSRKTASGPKTKSAKHKG